MATVDNFHVLNTTKDDAVGQLARLKDYFGFDGWLVNIENELDKGPVTKRVFLVYFYLIT